MGHLHTLELHPTNASLIDLEVIFAENGKGWNKTVRDFIFYFIQIFSYYGTVLILDNLSKSLA